MNDLIKHEKSPLEGELMTEDEEEKLKQQRKYEDEEKAAKLQRMASEASIDLLSRQAARTNIVTEEIRRRLDESRALSMEEASLRQDEDLERSASSSFDGFGVLGGLAAARNPDIGKEQREAVEKWERECRQRAKSRSRRDSALLIFISSLFLGVIIYSYVGS